MFQTLFERLLNHLYHNVNEKVSVKPLSLICINSILTTIHSLKNCSVFGRLNLVKFKGKNKHVIHQPSASGGTQDPGHSFPNTDLPVGE